MEEKICYLEDEYGGFLCYAKDKEYFINGKLKPAICCEGTKEEVEEYLGSTIEIITINVPPKNN